MAIANLGIKECDWVSKDAVEFQSVQVKEGRSYLFFLKVDPTTTTRNQYLAVIASFSTAEGEVELPLECKYFPNGQLLLVPVSVPGVDLFKDVPLKIVVLPKEFKKGSATEKLLDIELLFEEKEQDKGVYVIG